MPSVSLSVVIPTHNRAALLARAVEGALAAEAEVIVVDDASSDETPEVMRAHPSPRLKYRRLDQNRGPCFARNVGVDLAEGDLLLFLDDDDELLPGGAAAITLVAERHPEYDLYLHNCIHHPGGSTSVDPSGEPVKVEYRDWLSGAWDLELKPAARRELFRHHRYDDTGASGEGLLWGRVVRERGALMSPTPVIAYNSEAEDRLTSTAGLLRNAGKNAAIAELWLEYFGDDTRAEFPQRWADRVAVAATYRALNGEGPRARALLQLIPAGLLPRRRLAALAAVTRTPPIALRTGFRAIRALRRLRPRRGSR